MFMVIYSNSKNLLYIAIIVPENVNLKIFPNCPIFLYFVVAILIFWYLTVRQIFLYFVVAILIFDWVLPFWLWLHFRASFMLPEASCQKRNSESENVPKSCNTQQIQKHDIETQDDGKFILSFTKSLPTGDQDST